MKTIPLSEILIADRQRTEFPSEAILKLAAAIKKVGLINAIMLRDDEKTLVAGECRTRAIELLAKEGTAIKYDGQDVPLGHVPYTTLGECDEVIAQEVELLENLIRLDLGWKDKDAAILKIKRLVALKAGVDLEEVKPKQVAREMLQAKGVEEPKAHQLQSAKSSVEMAELREMYKNDPRVLKAKSAAEADKIIKKDLEAKQREKLAETFKDVQTNHIIKIGDCLELVKELEDEVVDVVCADPIYGIGADDMHMFQRLQYNEDGHHQYDDSWENWDSMFEVMPRELFRVAKPEAACYLFCDITRFFDFFAVRPGNTKPSRIKGLATRMAEAGWDVWPRPLVWYKGNIGSLPKPEHGPRYTTEYVLFATKGKKKTTGVYHDVISVPQTTGHVHGAGKPPAVYYDLLRRSAVPGDVVLDFAAGSFPILPAANEIGCQAIAWELNPKWEKEAELRKTLKISEEE